MGENDRPRCQAHPRGGVFFRAAHFPCFQKVLYTQGGLQPLVQSFHEGRPREGTAEKDPRKAGRQRNAFIAARFASARRRGLWHPLRNSIDNDLSALAAEARREAAE